MGALQAGAIQQLIELIAGGVRRTSCSATRSALTRRSPSFKTPMRRGPPSSFWTLRVRTRSRAIVIISHRPEGYPHPGRSTRDGSDRMQSVTKQTQVP